MTGPTDKSGKSNPTSKQGAGSSKAAIADRAAPASAAQPAGKPAAQPASQSAAQHKSSSGGGGGGKGVDYYAFLDPNGTFQCTFSQPIDHGKAVQESSLNVPGVMQKSSLQITTGDTGGGNGRFSWTASVNGNPNPICSRYAGIDPASGSLGNSNMDHMLGTPSQFSPAWWALSYGFFDSWLPNAGLTNKDQSYVYLTRNMSDWMGQLASEMGVALAQKPFSVWALPGAHDSGMFDMTAMDKIITDVALITAFAGPLVPVLGDFTFEADIVFLSGQFRRGVINFAMTQKDNFTAMLNLGVRYFDFRPGYCLGKLIDGMYHQHLVIPGCNYKEFLTEVMTWLAIHTGEIVVISLNFQNVAGILDKPSTSELFKVVEEVQKATTSGRALVLGDKTDLSTSYETLMAENKRLIFLNQIGAPDDAAKNDSYNASDYSTTNVENILQALGGMTMTGQMEARCDYTVLQVQGTSTNTFGARVDAAASLSNASSPLMSTKPGFDNQTYPWLLENVSKNLSAGQLVVFLNDFADNALASVAVEVTKQRMKQLPDLWFIKTQNTGTGTIEVHQRTAASNFQTGIDSGSDLRPASASNGWLQMMGSDLWFIQTQNLGAQSNHAAGSNAQTGTNSGSTASPATAFLQRKDSNLASIEAKNLGPQSNNNVLLQFRPLKDHYQSAADLLTFLNSEPDNGWYQIVVDDLWFIQTKNTGSQSVTVQQCWAATDYYPTGIKATTSLSAADADNGVYQMVGRDLWFIKTKNAASGFVEVHQRSAMTNYQGGLDMATSITLADAANGVFQMVGSDLWFIKTKNVGSGFVEVHQRTIASNYQSGLDAPTGLLPADGGNGKFQMGWPVLP